MISCHLLCAGLLYDPARILSLLSLFSSALHFCFSCSLSPSFIRFSIVYSLSSLHLFSPFRPCSESSQLTSSLLGRLGLVQILRCNLLTLALPAHVCSSFSVFALLLHGRVEIFGGLAREADFSLAVVGLSLLQPRQPPAVVLFPVWPGAALYIHHFVPIRRSP